MTLPVRALAYVLSALVVIGCVPLLIFVGVGLYFGFDVPAGLASLLYEPHGTTISEEKVPRTWHETIWTGDLENHLLSEGSGLAQSSVEPGVFFSINDSLNGTRIFALKDNGADLGFWKVDVERNVDWEDLASFTLDGEAYLLIADTGDNFRWRRVLNLHVIREPRPAEMSVDQVIPVAWTIRFRYPHGYRDSEAVAVDEKEQAVYVISKRTIPAQVYRLPLRPDEEVVTATQVAVLDNIPQPNDEDMWQDPYYGDYRSMPTAFDIKGDIAAVITYKDAYVYRKRPREDWSAAFGRLPTRIALPPVHAQEAGLVSDDGKYLYVTGERPDGIDRVGLYRVEL